MRNPNRIIEIKKYCLISETVDPYFYNNSDTDTLRQLLHKWYKNFPDLRWGQFLSMFGLDHLTSFAFNEEEEYYFVDKKLIPIEYLASWTSKLNKNGKPLKKLKQKFLVDLSTTHIENILRTQSNINEKYREYFEKRIKLRNKLKSIIDGNINN